MAKKRMHPLLGEIDGGTPRRQPRSLDGEAELGQGLTAEQARQHLQERWTHTAPAESNGMLLEDEPELRRKSVPVSGYREPGMAPQCGRCGGLGGHMPGCPAQEPAGGPAGSEMLEDAPSIRRLLGRILRGLAARIEGDADDEL